MTIFLSGHPLQISYISIRILKLWSEASSCCSYPQCDAHDGAGGCSAKTYKSDPYVGSVESLSVDIWICSFQSSAKVHLSCLESPCLYHLPNFSIFRSSNENISLSKEPLGGTWKTSSPKSRRWYKMSGGMDVRMDRLLAGCSSSSISSSSCSVETPGVVTFWAAWLDFCQRHFLGLLRVTTSGTSLCCPQHLHASSPFLGWRGRGEEWGRPPWD